MKIGFRGPKAARRVIADALRDDSQTTSSAVDPQLSIAERVRGLTSAGQVDDAIQLVQQETGMSLAEAEKFIDALDS